MLVLLPAGTTQVVKLSRDFWSTLPGAVDGRVTMVTEPWALTPGFEVGDLAERFAVALHPSTKFKATTRGAQ